MRRLGKVNHFVNDYVFEQVLGLRYKLRVQTNVPRLVVAASPLRFHPLQEILSDAHSELGLPFLDQQRHHLMEKRLMPLVHDVAAFFGIASGADRQRDASMVERNRRLGVSIGNGQKMPTTP